MRVRGYDEHRLKDPYKFWSKLLDTPPRRSTRCVATYTYVSRIDDSMLRFTYDTTEAKGTGDQAHLEDKTFCILNKNNVWTITVPVKDLKPSHATRLRALMGVWVDRDKKTFWNYENSVRVRETWNRSWPYEPGVQVRRGFIVDKERYVDKKRVIDTAGADVVKKKLEKIRELAPIMVRLLEAHGVDDTTWMQGKLLKAELFSQFDPDNITAMDAERVYRIGQATTCRNRVVVRHGVWNPRYGGFLTPPVYEDESIEAYRRRCIVNGLRKLREHIYSKEGVYQYEPVKD